MIFDVYKTNDPVTQRSLEKLDTLLLSKMFLSALGEDAEMLQIPIGFSVVTDIVKANKMMTSQEIWEMQEPWPYQYLVGITGDEWGRLLYKSGLDKSHSRKLADVVGRGMDDVSLLLKKRIDQ